MSTRKERSFREGKRDTAAITTGRGERKRCRTWVGIQGKNCRESEKQTKS